MGKLNTLLAKYSANVLREVDSWANKRWYVNPLIGAPQGNSALYLALAREVRNAIYPKIDQYEEVCGAAIDRAWMDELALHTQVVVKKSPLCYAHGRVLYSAMHSWLRAHPARSPVERVNIIETGTARGFSSLCMAKALADQHRAGAILTLDVLPHTSPMYWNCVDDHDGQKSRAELLRPWSDLVDNYIVFLQGDTRVSLPKVRCGRIHFAFLDGAHTYDDVMFEFAQIAPFQQSGDMIVYDDYSQVQFPGLVMAVDEICAHHGYDRTDLHAHSDRGYVVAAKR